MRFSLRKKEIKKYSGLSSIPNGHASDIIIPGCLVLEGGAFRGVYTSGVLDALMQNNINLQTTVGVSAGALTGMNYVAGQIGRSARVNLGFRHDSRYIGRKALKSSGGVFGFNFLIDEYEEMDPFDQKAFDNPNKRFIAAATSCETGQQRYFEKGICADIMQAARASSAMQFLTKMVDVEGEKCLDGGVSRRVPIQFALDENFEKIVVVRTRNREYRKKNKQQKAQARIYRKFPEFAEALKNSDIEYNRECDLLDELERQGRIFQIAPSQKVKVSRLEGNMEKLGDLYYQGYNDAIELLGKLKAYLNIV